MNLWHDIRYGIRMLRNLPALCDCRASPWASGSVLQPPSSALRFAPLEARSVARHMNRWSWCWKSFGLAEWVEPPLPPADLNTSAMTIPLS